MDHNPFISRNNDLFMMLIGGSTIVFVNTYLLPLSVQAQFLAILTFGFLAGLFMTYLYQSLEWALFFALGVQLVAVTPLALGIMNGEIYTLSQWITHVWATGEHSLFLLSSWIIAIPTGFMTQRLIMGDYYRKKTL